MQPNKARADLWMDLGLVAFLIAFDVAARLLPHAPGFMPVAASACSPAACCASRRWRSWCRCSRWPERRRAAGRRLARHAVVYAAIAIPALAGMLTRRWGGALPIVPTMVASSLMFFAASNFAVWAFNGMYPMTWQGLTQCYVAALPFLDKTVLGDLFWTAVLFGGAWLVQTRPGAGARAHI